MKKRKVFGIGFHKTGTTSLGEALRILGYRVTGPNWVHASDIAETACKRALRRARRFDAFQDNPWPLLYKDLDRAFPESLFILTVRETDAWLGSLLKHAGEENTPMRSWIYGFGSPVSHEEAYGARYEQHNRDVLTYFKNRPSSLLVLRLTDGEGWKELCEFLHAPVPEIPFPHSNMAGTRHVGTKSIGKRLAGNVEWLRRRVTRARSLP